MAEDHFMQFSFGHYGVGDVETGVLPDVGTVDVEFLENPVVQFASDFELEGAEGVGDAFETVADGVGVVIEGVDAPFVAHVRV